MSMRISLRAWISLVVITVNLGAFVRAQPIGPGRSRFDVRIQILEDASVRVTETITTKDSIDFRLERELPLLHRDQRGNRWKVRYRVLRVLLDGAPTNYDSVEKGESLFVRVEGAKAPTTQGEHSFLLEYLSSNEIRRIGNVDELKQEVRAPMDVDKESITIAIPRTVAFEETLLTAFTDATAATLSCACQVKREGGQWNIETTHPLQVGQQLWFSFDLPAGYLKRDFYERVQALEENNSTATAWAVFLVSILVYYGLVTAFLLLAFGKKVLRPAWFDTRSLVFISGALSVVSLLALPIVQQPYVAMPGILAGMVASMFIGGGVHGPAQKWLWIPLAGVANFFFFFSLSSLVCWIVRKAQNIGFKPVSQS